MSFSGSCKKWEKEFSDLESQNITSEKKWQHALKTWKYVPTGMLEMHNNVPFVLLQPIFEIMYCFMGEWINVLKMKKKYFFFFFFEDLIALPWGTEVFSESTTFPFNISVKNTLS